MRGTKEQIRSILLTRKRAYQRVFTPASGETVDQRRVLADMARFCGAGQSLYNKEPAEAARLAGRYEVWIHVQKFLQFTDSELLDLYRGLSTEENPPIG